MKALRARITPEDEEGERLGLVAIEMTEAEVHNMRADKINQLERGVSLCTARGLIADINALDHAARLISDQRRNNP